MAARWHGTLLAALVFVAVLAGCSEPQQASDTLPPTSAPTTEPTPTLAPLGPADLPVPDEARQQTADGADAFLRYYVDLLNHQLAIPAGQPLRDLSQDCRDCNRIASAYDETAAAGQHYVGGALSVVASVPFTLNGDTATNAFGLRQEAVSIAAADGSTVERTSLPEQPNLSSGITLTWSAAISSWLVSSLTIG